MAIEAQLSSDLPGPRAGRIEGAGLAGIERGMYVSRHTLILNQIIPTVSLGLRKLRYG